MNAEVVRRAVGSLDLKLGEARSALRQIESDIFGYPDFFDSKEPTQEGGYEDPKGALGHFLEQFEQRLLIVLEAAELPDTKKRFSERWDGFKSDFRGLSQVAENHALDSAHSLPLAFAEEIVEGLRLSINPDTLSDIDAYKIGRLERLLKETPFHLHNRNFIPSNEADVRRVIFEYLQVLFDGARREKPIPGHVKDFKPDFDILEIQAAVEFKFVRTKQDVGPAFSEIVEDVTAYRAAPHIKRNYAVIYQADPFVKQSDIEAHLKSLGAEGWKAFAVHWKVDASPRAAKGTTGKGTSKVARSQIGNVGEASFIG